MAQVVKNLLETKETQIRSLGREDPLEKGMATHLSILSWRIPWTEEPGRLQSTRSKELDRTEQLTLFPECANLFLFSVLFFQSNLSLWNNPASPPSSGFCEDLLLQAPLYPLQGLCFQILHHFYILSA